MSNADALREAYAACSALAASHYENFPVASHLLPRRVRPAVAVIYAFARRADDIADEGDAPAEQRLAELENYREGLRRIERGEAPSSPLFHALGDVIECHRLPLQPFFDLLSAFAQDVEKRRYNDFDELRDYCRRSADPVGRLMLYLVGEGSEENLQLSDQICSALQLINFYQDLQQDIHENDRIYLPQDEMERFGVSEAHLREGRCDEAMQALLAFQLRRAEEMMREGAELGGRLSGRFGLEIRLIIEGGLMVLERLGTKRGSCFSRPRLRRLDYLRLLWRALRPGAAMRRAR